MFPFTREIEIKLEGLGADDVPLLIKRLKEGLDKKHPHSRFESDDSYLIHRTLKESFKLQKSKYSESHVKTRAEFSFFPEDRAIKVQIKIFQASELLISTLFATIYVTVGCWVVAMYSYSLLPYVISDKTWDIILITIFFLTAPFIFYDMKGKTRSHVKLLIKLANELKHENQ